MITCPQRLFQLAIDAIQRAGGAQPRCHVVLAVDIASFASRDEAMQIHMRNVLYQTIRRACRTMRNPWFSCRLEDRGDGVLLVIDSRIGLGSVFTRLVPHIRAGIRVHNQTALPEARIQLRIAVHSGFLHRDAHGVTGTTVTHLFRLLDAPVMKKRLADQDADSALIISDDLYPTAIGYHLIKAEAFKPVTVDVKETHAEAWLSVPDAL